SSPSFAQKRGRPSAAVPCVGLSLDAAHFPAGRSRFDNQLVDGPSSALLPRPGSDRDRHSILLPVAQLAYDPLKALVLILSVSADWVDVRTYGSVSPCRMRASPVLGLKGNGAPARKSEFPRSRWRRYRLP